MIAFISIILILILIYPVLIKLISIFFITYLRKYNLNDLKRIKKKKDGLFKE